jgi:biotin carboxyl carrier protein
MPHLLAGWLAKRQKPRWKIQDQKIKWCQNPIHVLRELYRYLHWEKRSGLPPSEIIWEDDHLLLEEGLSFYEDLGNRLGYPEWDTLQKILGNKAPDGFDDELWSDVQAAHAGFQVGLVPLLNIPISLGISSRYFDWSCSKELIPLIPKEFQNTKNIKQYSQALAPPPPSHSDEVRSWTGGTFYACETPSSPPYVEAGQHVEQNDVLGLLEVMKMFNPIKAEFPGTVRQAYLGTSGGTLVSRGQLLFLIEPDHPIAEEDANTLAKYRQKATLNLLTL